MRTANGLRHPRYNEALRRVCSVAPLDKWPSHFEEMFFSGMTITLAERMQLCCFLYGNGAPAFELIVLLKHRLRDHDAVEHVKRISIDVQRDNRQRVFYYFDVNEQDVLYLDGTPHGVPRNVQQQYVRKMNSWNRYCFRHNASFHQQSAFFDQDDCDDAPHFFALNDVGCAAV